jgi:drug/metabolite transporter (DMT)-like permease
MTVRGKPFISKPSPEQRLKADFALLFVTLIWGLAFVVQRYAAPQVGVFLFNGIRFLLGALVLIPLAIYSRKGHTGTTLINREFILSSILAGILLFAGAAFQQAGLLFTTAGNAGFITGLYVIFIPIILALALRQSPRPVIWISAGLALCGLYLLSSGGVARPNIGDLLVLVSALIWACHVILIGWIVLKVELLPFVIGQYLVCGVLSILAGNLFGSKTPVDMLNSWQVLIFTGVISVGIGYTLQAASQRIAPPADAAIILSAEAIFAAFFGWILLDEYLNGIQIFGCVIIFAGMLLSQSDVILEHKNP